MSATGTRPDQQNYPANQRNEYQKPPPTGAIKVVHAACPDGPAGNEQGEIDDDAEDTFIWAEPYGIDKTAPDADQDRK